MTTIYGLAEPDGDLRYVGKADDASCRLRQHLQPAQLKVKTRKNSWIKSLQAKGKKPELVILQEVPDELADECEKVWIAYYRRLIGDRLTNGTEGGTGGAVTDPEARERIRQAHVGRKASAETREKISRSAKERCSDPKERARLAQISNGKPPVKRGSGNGFSKLTEESVKEIRRLYKEGWTGSSLALQFNVTSMTISYIIRRKTWTHI